jgi:hypothetical protein
MAIAHMLCYYFLEADVREDAADPVASSQCAELIS